MKYLLPLLLLSGCYYQTKSKDIADASEACTTNGGVQHIVPREYSYTILCNNGAEFYRTRQP